jgi:uncharacterized protein DUF4019
MSNDTFDKGTDDKQSSPRRRRRSAPRVPKRSMPDRWFAFAFGVIFVSVLLYLATVVTNPSPFALRVYITVLALSAAGVGAILPGFLEVQYKNYLRAGGAIALGVLVYMNEPAVGGVVTFVEPKAPPEPVADRYLTAVDAGDWERAWSLMPSTARKHVRDSKTRFQNLYRAAVEPLGKPSSRVLLGASLATSPPGAPPGIYRILTYKTRFTNDNGPRAEQIVVRGNSEQNWEIFSHQVAMSTLPN